MHHLTNCGTFFAAMARPNDALWEPTDEQLRTLAAEVGADVRAQSRALKASLRAQIAEAIARQQQGTSARSPCTPRQSPG